MSEQDISELLSSIAFIENKYAWNIKEFCEGKNYHVIFYKNQYFYEILYSEKKYTSETFENIDKMYEDFINERKRIFNFLGGKK